MSLRADTNHQSPKVELQEFFQRLNNIAQNATGETKADLNALLLDINDSEIEQLKLAREAHQNAWKR